MTAPLLVLPLTTAIYALLGVAVWRSKPSGAANRAFAYLALTLGAWTLSNGLVATYAGTPWGTVWARAAFFSASLLPLWCFHFVAVFPTPAPRVSDRLRSVMTVCALASCALSLTPLVAQTTSVLNGTLKVTYGPLYPLFGTYLVASLAGSLALLSRKHRLLTGVERLQVQFVLLGIGIAAIGGSITNLLVPLVFRTSRLNTYGPVVGLVMLAFIAHAIVRYRLLNIRLVVRRGVTDVGASIIAGVAFVGVAGIVAWALALRLQALPIEVALVLALLLAQAFQPLRRVVQAGLDRYFFRTRYDYPVALREISRAMSDIIEMGRLFEYTCRAISETVHAERVSLYVRDAGGSDYRLESSWGAEEPRLPATIGHSSALVQSLSLGTQRALIAADFRRHDGALAAESDDIHRLGIECILPVLVHGKFEGFYVIGSKRSGDPYFTEDIDLISAVASQVGIAIKLHVQSGLAEAERRRAERLVSFGALARELAHEIKNPLVAIRTFAELLPERADDAEFRDSFSQIVVQEIGRIDELVRRLRGFPGPSAPRFQEVDLAALVRETLALLRGEIQRARIRVTITARHSLPPILGDPSQLTQLLLNILMNALEAVEPGGQIAIRFSHVADQRRVVLDIVDSGPGVPVELLPKIFDAFVTTKAEGSGLGLAICRGITDAHHASIRAENGANGRGLRIVLDFPALERVSGESAGSVPPNARGKVIDRWPDALRSAG
jgi:signal transduction histidine kinase